MSSTTSMHLQKEHPIEGAQLYSNRADYVFLLAGQRSKWLPNGETLGQFVSDPAPSSEDVYVAFLGGYDGGVVGATQDGRKVDLALAADDGRIYRISRQSAVRG